MKLTVLVILITQVHLFSCQKSRRISNAVDHYKESEPFGAEELPPSMRRNSLAEEGPKAVGARGLVASRLREIFRKDTSPNQQIIIITPPQNNPDQPHPSARNLNSATDSSENEEIELPSYRSSDLMITNSDPALSDTEVFVQSASRRSNIRKSNANKNVNVNNNEIADRQFDNFLPQDYPEETDPETDDYPIDLEDRRFSNDDVQIIRVGPTSRSTRRRLSDNRNTNVNTNVNTNDARRRLIAHNRNTNVNTNLNSNNDARRRLIARDRNTNVNTNVNSNNDARRRLIARDRNTNVNTNVNSNNDARRRLIARDRNTNVNTNVNNNNDARRRLIARNRNTNVNTNFNTNEARRSLDENKNINVNVNNVNAETADDETATNDVESGNVDGDVIEANDDTIYGESVVSPVSVTSRRSQSEHTLRADDSNGKSRRGSRRSKDLDPSASQLQSRRNLKSVGSSSRRNVLVEVSSLDNDDNSRRVDELLDSRRKFEAENLGKRRKLVILDDSPAAYGLDDSDSQVSSSRRMSPTIIVSARRFLRDRNDNKNININNNVNDAADDDEIKVSSRRRLTSSEIYDDNAPDGISSLVQQFRRHRVRANNENKNVNINVNRLDSAENV
ncbi:putative uncharacterized protein DDB_G0282133 [Microplitis demolitor]|uniref:putative uncharacterized protein DDB_G0282133 n=1 Tax=Microplitis demolitor TaxID=69319 RepID=UPI00044001C5|nr:putative uncharacterized protein DDB_G0282133 [Microplitis demolitor]